MEQTPSQPRRSQARRSASVETTNGILTAMAGVREWRPLWGAFQTDQGDWCSRVASGNPLYCLPLPIIDGLGPPGPQDHVGRRVFLSAQDANAEAAFTAVCQSHSTGCVGVWLDRPIDFPLLNSAVEQPPVTIPTDLIAEWATLTNRPAGLLDHQVQDALGRLQHTQRQLLGYCGWLRSNSDFEHELAGVRELWQPSDCRGSTNILLAPPQIEASNRRSGTRRLRGRRARFHEALDGLCGKWFLAGLATWDLPLPQGPLESLPAALVARLRGPDAIVDHFPLFFDIPSDIDLREQVRDRQAIDGQLQGISGFPVTNTSPRAGRLSEFTNLVRLWLIEHAVQQRCGSPRGIVTRVVELVADVFGVSTDRVRQLHRRCRSLH
jgi:hypothetical protein